MAEHDAPSAVAHDFRRLAGAGRFDRIVQFDVDDDRVAVPPERDDVKAIEPKPIETNHRQPPRCKTAGHSRGLHRELI